MQKQHLKQNMNKAASLFGRIGDTGCFR